MIAASMWWASGFLSGLFVAAIALVALIAFGRLVPFLVRRLGRFLRLGRLATAWKARRVLRESRRLSDEEWVARALGAQSRPDSDGKAC